MGVDGRVQRSAADSGAQTSIQNMLHPFFTCGTSGCFRDFSGLPVLCLENGDNNNRIVRMLLCPNLCKAFSIGPAPRDVQYAFFKFRTFVVSHATHSFLILWENVTTLQFSRKTTSFIHLFTHSFNRHSFCP